MNSIIGGYIIYYTIGSLFLKQTLQILNRAIHLLILSLHLIHNYNTDIRHSFPYHLFWNLSWFANINMFFWNVYFTFTTPQTLTQSVITWTMLCHTAKLKWILNNAARYQQEIKKKKKNTWISSLTSTWIQLFHDLLCLLL